MKAILNGVANDINFFVVAVYALILAVVLLLSSVSLISQEVYKDCPVGGANSTHADSLKNRYLIPADSDYLDIPFSYLSQKKFTDTASVIAVKIKGFISCIKDGAAESCNCHSKTIKDTHIYISPNSSSIDKDESIIVEVTPRLRETLGSTATLKKNFLNQYVIVYGYIFCDEEHKAASTADKGKASHWRASVWEIHPVTKIELQ